MPPTRPPYPPEFKKEERIRLMRSSEKPLARISRELDVSEQTLRNWAAPVHPQAALGPDPEREALEGVLLLLVGEGRLSLERAGEVLGFEDREEARRWYAERARTRPEPTAEDPA